MFNGTGWEIVDLIGLAEDRDSWGTLVNKSSGSKKCREFVE
jgi:hypothetical protein